jgi:hypothetical protein
MSVNCNLKECLYCIPLCITEVMLEALQVIEMCDVPCYSVILQFILHTDTPTQKVTTCHASKKTLLMFCAR